MKEMSYRCDLDKTNAACITSELRAPIHFSQLLAISLHKTQLVVYYQYWVLIG